ncbi:serine/threonine-protein kinase [Actinoplanes utahensis]|uniref:serine/threonine-protein kinase n=2 Tax=Actinoplanes utahensis TaxID=1869 RepID=UPI00068DF194|nr:serine/threonine-protein kinase [Actinoplanes utahensis]
MAGDEPLGREYLLHEEIGRGASAVVRRATSRHGGPPLAAKVLHAGYAGDRRVRNLILREEAALRDLHHESIVSLRDLVVEGGRITLVTEYVDGPNLRQHLTARGGRLSTAEAGAIGARVAAALAAAHAQGVVHLDLKPENVLIGPDTVKITDFGVAALLSDAQPLATGGTPGYIAPELITGGTATAAADVYALGILLTEMITGSIPEGPPGPDAPPLIHHCLATDPRDRPSARAVAAQLRAAVGTPPPVPAAPLRAAAAVPLPIPAAPSPAAVPPPVPFAPPTAVPLPASAASPAAVPLPASAAPPTAVPLPGFVAPPAAVPLPGFVAPPAAVPPLVRAVPPADAPPPAGAPPPAAPPRADVRPPAAAPHFPPVAPCQPVDGPPSVTVASPFASTWPIPPGACPPNSPRFTRRHEPDTARLDLPAAVRANEPATARIDLPAAAGANEPATARIDLPAAAGANEPATARKDLPAAAETNEPDTARLNLTRHLEPDTEPDTARLGLPAWARLNATRPNATRLNPTRPNATVPNASRPTVTGPNPTRLNPTRFDPPGGSRSNPPGGSRFRPGRSRSAENGEERGSWVTEIVPELMTPALRWGGLTVAISAALTVMVSIVVGITIHVGGSDAADRALPPPVPVTVTPSSAAPTVTIKADPVAVDRTRATYAAHLPEGTLYLALRDGIGIAYLCDGDRVEAWFRGTAARGAFHLSGRQGTVDGTFTSAHATGEAIVEGRALGFALPAVRKPSGLYRASARVRDAEVKGGWIVLSDGRQVGVLTVAGEPRPAPPLDTTGGTADVDGTPVTATEIDVENGSGF